MNCFLQRAGMVLALACAANVVMSQDRAAHTFTDQELKSAGWTDQQIAQLREMAPKADTQELGNNTSAKAPRLSYSSVFESYVPFDYLPDIGWREANDRVGEIGGWRAYLKMVQDEVNKEAQSKEADDQ